MRIVTKQHCEELVSSVDEFLNNTNRSRFSSHNEAAAELSETWKQLEYSSELSNNMKVAGLNELKKIMSGEFNGIELHDTLDIVKNIFRDLLSEVNNYASLSVLESV